MFRFFCSVCSVLLPMVTGPLQCHRAAMQHGCVSHRMVCTHLQRRSQMIHPRKLFPAITVYFVTFLMGLVKKRLCKKVWVGLLLVRGGGFVQEKHFQHFFSHLYQFFAWWLIVTLTALTGEEKHSRGNVSNSRAVNACWFRLCGQTAAVSTNTFHTKPQFCCT